MYARIALGIGLLLTALYVRPSQLPHKLESDPKLWTWYQTYNRKYFGGKLTENKLLLLWSNQVCRTNDDACSQLDANGLVTIAISADLKDHEVICKMLLLHEMVHIDLWRKGEQHSTHDAAFQKRMMQLAKKGAFKNLW